MVAFRIDPRRKWHSRAREKEQQYWGPTAGWLDDLAIETRVPRAESPWQNWIARWEQVPNLRVISAGGSIEILWGEPLAVVGLLAKVAKLFLREHVRLFVLETVSPSERFLVVVSIAWRIFPEELVAPVRIALQCWKAENRWKTRKERTWANLRKPGWLEKQPPFFERQSAVEGGKSELFGGAGLA